MFHILLRTQLFVGQLVHAPLNPWRLLLQSLVDMVSLLLSQHWVTRQELNATRPVVGACPRDMLPAPTLLHNMGVALSGRQTRH